MPTYGSFKYAEAKYGGSWYLKISELIGSYKGFRFNAILNSQGSKIIDKDILTSDATIYMRYLKEGLIMMFETEGGSATDYIFIMSPMFDDLQASQISSMTLHQLGSSADEFYLSGADFLDGKKIQWNWGCVPYDTSRLIKLGDSFSWNGEDGAATVWSALGATVYSTGTIVYNNGLQGPLPAGKYAIYWLVAGDGTTDGTVALQTYAEGTWITMDLTDIPAAGQWYGPQILNFRYSSSPDVDYLQHRFQRTGGSGQMNIGEVIAVPISNSKNFPLDVVHQSINIQTIFDSL